MPKLLSKINGTSDLLLETNAILNLAKDEKAFFFDGKFQLVDHNLTTGYRYTTTFNYYCSTGQEDMSGVKMTLYGAGIHHVELKVIRSNLRSLPEGEPADGGYLKYPERDYQVKVEAKTVDDDAHGRKIVIRVSSEVYLEGGRKLYYKLPLSANDNAASAPKIFFPDIPVRLKHDQQPSIKNEYFTVLYDNDFSNPEHRGRRMKMLCDSMAVEKFKVPDTGSPFDRVIDGFAAPGTFADYGISVIAVMR